VNLESKILLMNKQVIYYGYSLQVTLTLRNFDVLAYWFIFGVAKCHIVIINEVIVVKWFHWVLQSR